jgi:hypothetical protein
MVGGTSAGMGSDRQSIARIVGGRRAVTAGEFSGDMRERVE